MAAAAMIVALLVVTGALAHLGAAVVARHRAQAAADLGALAAAVRVPTGAADSCAQAAAIARAMRARVTGCVVDGLDVFVSVEVPAAGGRWGTARAAARAGPA